MQNQIMVIMSFSLSTWFVFFNLNFNCRILPLDCPEFYRKKDCDFLNVFSLEYRHCCINLIFKMGGRFGGYCSFLQNLLVCWFYFLGYFIRLYLMRIPIGSYYWSMVSFITCQTPCQRHVARRWIQCALKHEALT